MAEIIPRYSMLSAGDRVGMAVSGGADSVVLLHILQRLSHRFQVNLVGLHVNHHLRGAESDADEEFVRTLGKSLGIEVFTENAELGEGNLEQMARQARRKFFQVSMEQHGLSSVALGHTRSDQAETVLFRFLRGSGLAGLAGMRMVTGDRLIRPLLTTSREEVRNWAAAEGIMWREDSTNSDLNFGRNRLRHQTIPWLAREFNPNLEAVLAGTAELAQSEEDYWFQEIEPRYREITKRTHLGSILHVPFLAALPTAVQRRVLRRALLDVRGDLRSIDREHIEAILSLCPGTHGHARVIVPGIDALRSFDELLLTKPGELNSEKRHYCLEVPVGGECQLPFRAGSLNLNWVKREDEFCANFKEEQEFRVEVAYLDADALTGPTSRPSLQVRNWEPGDELQRQGHRQPQKIKSLFQEQRVVLWERRHWPVAVAGEEVVWVRQFGSAAKFSGSHESHRSVRLIYRPNHD
ncbi:MAG: tRNA lysidine(34) synthetase TilS [Acidobacteriaceae bacterium]|nr:tRNA lysidine(34) synthetase TilS [Acidobacteriaceae bacterium]